MQLYKHNTSCDGTHKQAGGRSVDAATAGAAVLYSTSNLAKVLVTAQ